jgi:hypothetical protein
MIDDKIRSTKFTLKIVLIALATFLIATGVLLVINAFESVNYELEGCKYTVSIYEQSAQMMYDYNTEIVNDDGSTIDYFNVTCNEYFKLKGWC